MDSLWQEIGINVQHVCETQVPKRFQLICDKQWLQRLEREHRIAEFPVWTQLDHRAHPTGILQHPWTRILVQTYEKQTQTKVFCLAQNCLSSNSSSLSNSISNDLDFLPLTYSQAIAYVSNENFNKLWYAAYKQYQTAHIKHNKQFTSARRAHSPGSNNSNNAAIQSYNATLRLLIQQLWHCPLLRTRQQTNEKSNLFAEERADCHANLPAAIAAIETSAHISVFFYPPAVVTSIYDCITYSPAVLSKNYNKSLFLIYQILQIAKSFQTAGLFLGDVRLHDFLMCDNLWLELVPSLQSNLLAVQKQQHENLTASECIMDDGFTLDLEQDEQKSCSFDLKFAYDLQQFNLREYCEMWCCGQLSNFDYLTILNNAAGRSLNNPAYHHIMPWVTDFTARNGTNWRDLSKSKYRLNKGDLHLDLMFNQTHNVAQATPHHVSDFLSEITYFVYMARRTPQHILREHVRPKWVPAEYPVSIQRLQAWTPDECIPQFYTDPMIFKSIHEDLADLELPTWATCPEDFISKHREALESHHVSQRLHQWIDLNFGYKLTGKAAIKSKNVCLTLVDQHKQLCQRGIVQLFTQPHPPKRFASTWFDSKPPRLTVLKKLDTNLSKSMESLAANKIETMSNCSFYGTSNLIELPKDYNPYALLQNFEIMHAFFARTFPRQKSLSNIQQKITQQDLLFDDSSEEHSYTNQVFAASLSPTDGVTKTTNKNPSLLAPSAQQLQQKYLQNLLAERRLQELQVLGCLIVEILMMHKMRALLMNYISVSFEQRLLACRTVYELHQSDIPKCLRQMVGVLLHTSNKTMQEVVNDKGLPLPPTAAQMLEPIFSNTLLPFAEQYYASYALMRSLRAYKHCAILLELYTHFNCNGKQCAQFTYQDRQRVLFERKIAECQVMSCCAHIGRLLEPTGFEQFNALELLLGIFIEFLTAEQTSILAAWYLFDPLAQALGIAGTQRHLLLPIIKLYDAESFERGMISVRTRPKLNAHASGQIQFSTNSSFKSRKSVKLYHHSFLLRLIVRFGLRCFLNNFITPLIEAVGGYKEPEEGTGFHYHENMNVNKENGNIFYETNVSAEVDLLSLTSMTTLQELTEINYEQSNSTTKIETEDVFTFEDDVNSDHISNSGTNENKSLNSFDSNLAEDAREYEENSHIYGMSQQSSSSHSLQQEEQQKQVESTFQGTKSPTIDIPRSAIERSFRLSAIDCHVGSKKSIDSFEIITQQVLEEQQKQQQLDKQLKSMKLSTDKVVGAENLQATVISRMSEAKVAQNNRISEMSAESLMWLSHRLGPVLTSCYITRNLLKMLSLCYVGQENLLPEIGSGRELRNTASFAGSLNYMTIAEARVLGDQNAARVLECLMSIAGIFGEQVILQQYFPHISELIALSKKRVSSSLEGAIISTLQLLKCIIPCLTDATIMEHLKDIILDAIILPIIELLSSTDINMPSGYLGRSVLARKLLDAIYALCVRIGPDMSKEHLCQSVLRSFFNIFNKPYGLRANNDAENLAAQEELRDVFGISLAHTAYVAFLQFLGDAIMTSTLENLDFILLLCHKYDQPSSVAATERKTESNEVTSHAVDCAVVENGMLSVTELDGGAANSFGTHIVGNRLQVKEISTHEDDAAKPTKMKGKNALQQEKEVLDMVAYKFDTLPTTRNLKGNWLAYWRHEVSRPEKDTALSLKQIKLQSFVGHTNSVRAILALDNENSFISASKDKTVKLWSLRSEGDGSKLTQCQFTYTAHKKSVHALTFLESMRYVVSCDSGVHVWDPFIGRPLSILDSSRHNPVTVVKCLSSPSPLVIAGTADCALKVLDTRSMNYVCDWKLGSATTQGSGVTVRCLTVAPSGNWLAVGLSSGSIVMLDTRTGMIINTWRPMECDLLQLAAANDQQLISSALDHSLAVWHAHDGILHYQMRPPAEPAHYLQTIGSELVFATTGNRIGFHADLNSPRAAHSITKLHSETFRGVLTSLAVLPLNRIFLAGNESGNINLLC